MELLITALISLATGALVAWLIFRTIIKAHNIEKYIRLDDDDPSRFLHTPDKFLFYPVHLPEPLEPLTNKSDYMEFYRNMLPVFGLQRSTRFPEKTSRVVLREWEPFAAKVFHTILSI